MRACGGGEAAGEASGGGHSRKCTSKVVTLGLPQDTQYVGQAPFSLPITPPNRKWHVDGTHNGRIEFVFHSRSGFTLKNRVCLTITINKMGNTKTKPAAAMFNIAKREREHVRLRAAPSGSKMERNAVSDGKMHYSVKLNAVGHYSAALPHPRRGGGR
jgi:hypothetical protein